MPVKVTCPGCQKKLTVRDELMGKRIKCPECQKVLSIGKPKQAAAPKRPSNVPPAQPIPQAIPIESQPPEKIKLKCACGSVLRVPSSARGKQAQCPKCSRKLQIPDATVAAPVATLPTAPTHDVTDASPQVAMALPVNVAPDHSVLDNAPFAEIPVAQAATDPFSIPSQPAVTPLDPAPMAATPAQPAALPGGSNLAPVSAGADPFAAAATFAPIANPAPKPVSGGEFWDSLPKAGGSSGATPSPAYNALAEAGAFTKSTDEKMGEVVSETESSESSSGSYFANRFHLALIGMILVGPFMTYSGWKTSQRLATLEERGVSVDGVITDGWTRRRRRSRSYYFSVMYQIESGAAENRDFGVTSSFYNDHEIGDAVEVSYDPDDLDNVIIVGGSSDSSLTLYLGIGITIFGLLGVGFTAFSGGTKEFG